MLSLARLLPSPPPKSAWAVLCLAVSISSGCGRPDAFHRTEAGSPAGQQNIPFHQDPDHASDDNSRPAIPPDRMSGSTSPFRAASHSRRLPAGTLITVQLENSLSISQTRAGDAFTASVAGPVSVDGDILIESGTPAGGLVESAQPTGYHIGSGQHPGFVRLTLDKITVDGKALALQTSSLFTRGVLQRRGSTSNIPSGQSGDFQVLRGRRLTFRLTTPVTLADSSSIANR